MQHSRESILRMAQAAYDAFEGRQKLLRLVLALACILAGLFAPGMPRALGLLFVAYGCYASVSLNNPARSRADSVLQVVKQRGGAYPCTLLRFEPDRLCIGAEGGNETQTVPYKELVRLMEDGEYFYLFVSRGAALMVPKTQISSGRLARFKEQLAQAAGLEILPLLPWWRLSLKQLRLRRRNTRMPKKERNKTR